MKKLTFALLLIYNFFSAQYNQNTIRVEVTNPDALNYELAYQRERLKSINSKLESDITILYQQRIDLLMRYDKLIKSYNCTPPEDMYKEILRLKNLCVDILVLKDLVGTNELTGNKIKYTVNKVDAEITDSITFGDLKKMLDFCYKQIK